MWILIIASSIGWIVSGGVYNTLEECIEAEFKVPKTFISYTTTEDKVVHFRPTPHTQCLLIKESK